MGLLAEYARDRFPEVAAKAPDDATLEAYMRDRFPELAAKVGATAEKRVGPPGQMGKYGGLPGDQANLEQPLLERFGQSVTQNVVDYGKSAIDTVMGREPQSNSIGGTLGRVGADVGIGAGKGFIDTAADIASLLGANVSPDFTAATQPENTAQQVGQFGERMAEFIAPAGLVTKGAKALKMGGLATTGLDALGQAAVAGGVDLLHGESMETAKRDATIAAIFPVTGKAIEKVLSGVSKSGVDRFFRQVTGEKKRGFEASVADTMQKEGIAGMRLQTLKDSVENKIATLRTEIADDVAAANASVPSLGVAGQIDGKLGIAVNRAKMANSEQAGRIEGAREAIAEKIKELSGGSGQLDAKGLNSLREHMGEMLKEAGYGRYHDELLGIYSYTKDLLGANVPGVADKLKRTSNMINVSKRFSQKMDELNNKKDSIFGVAGNVVRLAYQYTPSRMAIANTQRGLGTMAGVGGTAIPALSVGFGNTDSVEAPQPTMDAPMPQQQQPSPIGGAVGTFAPQIESAAQQANVDPLLLAALVSAESGGNPNARSNKNAVGLTQMTPIALKEIGMTKEDIATPEGQLLAGAKYLRLMLDQFNGNPSLALAAYNAGPGAVTRHKGIPPYKETQDYVPRVLRFYEALGGAPAAIGGL